MQIILTLLVVIIFIQLGKKRGKQNQIDLIKQSYGKKPMEASKKLTEISVLWDEYGDLVPNDEKIDHVTWNDLEMDNIFNRINMCNSSAGEQYLYTCLHMLPKDEGYNIKLEGKIKSLTLREEDRLEVQGLLMQIGKSDLGYYLPMFVNNLENCRINHIGLYRLMQILLILSFLPPIIFMDFSYLLGTGVVFLVNLGIYTMNKVKQEVYLDSLFNIISLVKIGKKIAKAKCIKGVSEFEELEKYLTSLNKMSRLAAGIERKKEASFSGDILGMVYDYVIGATLWDFIIYEKVCTILDNKQEDFLNLYKTIGEIDAAIAIASFRKSLPKYCLPEFINTGKIQIADIYHPLIDQPVYNTFNMECSSLITGSNASGKSTFIKAVTINILLAQCINTCMAQEAKVPRSWVITSMAVRDDLTQGESYYIREIKYLNRIIVSLESQRFIFCVIDEILKGTNSEERIKASFSILDYISKKNCMALVATHDKELTHLLNETFDNYHFEEQINNQDIVFDYQLRKGPATSQNAIKLLEYVGFPKEIIIKAKKGYSAE